MLMRTVFLHFELVLEPLGSMFTAADTIQWLYQLAQSLSDHADVSIVLFGEWTQTYPPMSGLAVMHAIGKRISAVASAQGDDGPIAGYLREHAEVDDFVVLTGIDTELPAPLQPHRIKAQPDEGLWDPSVIDLRQWLDGKARQRDPAAFGSLPHSDLEAKPAGSPSGMQKWPEPVVATVAVVIEEFELVHLEGPDGLTLCIGEGSAGVDWRQLRLGQRLECEVEGEHAVRVVRARLLPSEVTAPTPGNDEGSAK